MAETTLQAIEATNASRRTGAARRRSWWTIGRKITIASAVSITIGLAVMIWFAASLQTDNMVEVSDAAVTDITDLMAVQMGAAIRFNQAAAIEAVYDGQAETENAMIAGLLAINAEGGIVASLGDNLADRFALNLGVFRHSDDVMTVDEGSHLIVAVPIHFGNDNARVGTLIVGWSRALIDAKSAASAWTVTAVAAVIVVLLVGLLTVLLRRIVGSPLRRLEGVMTRLAGGDTEVAVPDIGRRDEIGDMAQAVQVFKDNAIEMKRMEAEKRAGAEAAAAEKRRTMDDLAGSFESTVKHIVDGVIGGLGDMKDNARSMCGLADQTSSESTEVAAAAEQATCNVNTVAAAAEEMSKSIAEIGERVAQSTRITGEAVTRAERTDTTVQGLADAASKIGEVVKMISAIAEQTNLLALNATIEAARAGDAGKGFAVVASEVKNLANQTAKATEQIGAQIADMQSVTGDAVTAIQEIRTTIVEVSEIATTIAAAIEEQSAATQEIARNTTEAATGTQSVAGKITNVKAATESTGKAAGSLLEAVNGLADQADVLRREVDDFLTKVRVA